MDIAYLSTLSALAGSAVGGLTSGVATWLSQRVQARENQLAREMARRDDLYKEFIAAASKAYGEAIVSNEPNVQEFVALYAMISRMRLQSPPQTIACAEKIMRATIDTYFAPGRTIREFHELAQSGSGIDLLKDFSEVTRGVAGIHKTVTVYRPNFLRPRSAQNFVNGFLSKLLPGFEPAVRIMSMRARNVAGTWRCPG
jgi:hypothetical protein